MFSKYSSLRNLILLSVFGIALVARAEINIQLTGPIETVFSWQKDRCNVDQIPDSPARAFQSKTLGVVLFAAHYTNDFLVGENLETLKAFCTNGYRASMRDDAELFDARIWLQSFYTENGTNVYALGSSDYHGSWFNRCSGLNARNPKCWRSAITLAVSNDGGRTFSSRSPPDHILARPPTDFNSESEGMPAGFFTASNIVQKAGHFYALVHTFGYLGQAPGNCVLRTNKLADPAAWMAWSGQEFDVSLRGLRKTNYTQRLGSECKPVSGLKEPIGSMLLHETSGNYIATFVRRSVIDRASGGVTRVEFRYSVSKDLMNWSDSRLIVAYDGAATCQIGAVATVSYPALLDPKSKDRNFGTVGESAFVYFTRHNSAPACKMSMDRDLVRVPVRISG